MELAYEEFEETLTDYSGALEDAFEVIDDLNSTAAVIQDEDQNDVNARLLEVSVESYLKRLVLNSRKYKKEMALESFVSNAASNVKKAAILVWEKIKAALTALYKKVTDFFKFLFNKNKETEKKINEAEKELEEDIKEFKKAADAAKKEQGGKVKENPPEYSFNDNSGIKKLGYSSGIQQTHNYVEPTPAKSHKKGSHYLEEHDVKLGLSDTMRHRLTHKDADDRYLFYNSIEHFFDSALRDKNNPYQFLEDSIDNFSRYHDELIKEYNIAYDKISNWTFAIGNAVIEIDVENVRSNLVYKDVKILPDSALTLSPGWSQLLLRQLKSFYKKYGSRRHYLSKIFDENIAHYQEQLDSVIKHINKYSEVPKYGSDPDEYKRKEHEYREKIRHSTLQLSIFLNIEKYYDNLINAVLFVINRSRAVYFSHNAFLLRNDGYIAAIDDFYKELK